MQIERIYIIVYIVIVVVVYFFKLQFFEIARNREKEGKKNKKDHHIIFIFSQYDTGKLICRYFVDIFCRYLKTGREESKFFLDLLKIKSYVN